MPARFLKACLAQWSKIFRFRLRAFWIESSLASFFSCTIQNLDFKFKLWKIKNLPKRWWDEITSRDSNLKVEGVCIVFWIRSYGQFQDKMHTPFSSLDFTISNLESWSQFPISVLTLNYHRHAQKNGTERNRTPKLSMMNLKLYQ